jgi:predicted acylesterase/phospholipase RssA
MSRILRLALAVALLACGGCASLPRTSYTAEEAAIASPPGFDHIRVWLDATTPNPHDFGPSASVGRGATYLALSGGGGNGAYGAGILNGWTESGTRPNFTAVSGVSTGALIAPFAFLGPSYDSQLKAIYTDGIAETLVQEPNFIEAAFGTSLFGSRRLLALVSRYVDEEMMEAIAREHRAGRRLYVLTSNIDSKRGVVWSIGAIAASGRPDSLDLMRKVLAASASIPLVFSPVLIDAEANGRTFQEMHADGNVTEAVFTLPLQYLAQQKHTRLSGGKIFILMNTVIEPQFSVVDDQTLKIVGASINTLLTQKTIGDLATTYAYTRVNHVDFNLTAIDPNVAQSGTKAFDTAYMRKLYAIGYDLGRSGRFWRKTPPVGGNNDPQSMAALK